MPANVQYSDAITYGSGILYTKKGGIDSGEPWVNIGQLIDEVTFSYDVELLTLEVGTPTTIVKQVKRSENASLAGSVVELTATNLQTTLGIADAYVDTVAATPVNVTDEDMTFTSTRIVWNTGRANISAVVIQDVTDTVTFTANTDYVVDAVNGTITFINSGTSGWTADSTVYHLDYKYTPDASKTINFGGAPGGLPEFGLRFVHTKPDGKSITIEFNKAQTNGAAQFSFAEGAWNQIPFTFTALADATKDAGKQLGKMIIEV
jgi:hypothetical protein